MEATSRVQCEKAKLGMLQSYTAAFLRIYSMYVYIHIRYAYMHAL